MAAAANASITGWRRKTFAIPVPIAMREVRPAMPATVVSASLLHTPSTMNTLSNPLSSARTARSTASRTPAANPHTVNPIFMSPLSRRHRQATRPDDSRPGRRASHEGDAATSRTETIGRAEAQGCKPCFSRFVFLTGEDFSTYEYDSENVVVTETRIRMP